MIKPRIIGYNCPQHPICKNGMEYPADTEINYCPLCGTHLSPIKEYDNMRMKFGTW